MTDRIDYSLLAREARDLQEWIVERRRHLHRFPELSFQEEKTAAFVRREVEALGLKPSDPLPGKYGFYADLISPANPDQFILLRADMDALPIQEENDVEYRSTIPGVGHLCGHDCHTSMLLGALRILVGRQAALPVSVRFVFQHGEEVNPGGARDFVAAGLTNKVLGCFGVHVSPRSFSETFGVCAGPTMAAVGQVDVTINGQGGHGAMPHEARDPVAAASACVLALQQVASRRTPPMESTVCSVTMINGGTANNIIPASVHFEGTFRTFNVDRIEEIEEMIRDICRNTARAWNCEADARATHSYPPLVNDVRAIAAARQAIVDMFGPSAIDDVRPHMGGEDFAYFAMDRPSAFVFLGVRPRGAAYYPLHHPCFLPDETMLWRGSAYLASMPFAAPGYLAENV